MKTRITLVLSVAILFAFNLCYAQATTQDSTSDEYELRPNEKAGYIVDKDGNKIDGIVKLMGTPTTPWVNQKKVKFIANTDINPDKKRQKFKTLDVDDLQEYAAYDGDLLRHFKLIKFTNKREGFTNNTGSGLSSDIKLIKNMSNTTYMAEAVVDGPITVYRLYGMPSPVAVGKKDVEENKEDIQRIIEHPDILYSKNGSKVKELNSTDIRGLVEECDYVKNKMDNNEYKTYNTDKQDKKRSKFGKLIKNEYEKTNDKTLDMALEIIPDYNSNCK